MNDFPILIVEDHPLFSKGLAQLINSEPQLKVIGEAETPQDALQKIEDSNPQMAIIDLNLGNHDGLELIKMIKSLNPDIKMLVLSMHDERYYAERVMKAGAQGYIMKDQAGNTVIDAIKAIINGEIWLSEPEKSRLQEYMSINDSFSEDKNWMASINKLSDRQLQIFNLIGKGLGTIEIADQLEVSTKTIDTHKDHIKQKLHCSSTLELRQLAIEWVSHSR